MSEVWKDIYFVENGEIFDYRGLYAVSNFGRVKSFHNGKEKILKPGNTGGYEIVNLCKNSKQKSFYIHRLVAHIFLTGCFDGAEVNHKDENKTNNHVSNLEWCTSKYNNNYGTRNERASESIKEAYHNKSDEEKAERSRKISEAMKGKNKGEKNGMHGRTGEKNPRAVLVDRFTLDEIYIDTKYNFEYVEELGFDQSGISNCCKGRYKSTGGFIFKYHKEE